MTKRQRISAAFLFGAIAFAALPFTAFADTYRDNAGTVTQPSVPLSCAPSTTAANSWVCKAAPLGANAVVSNTPTVQNAAYAASNAIGGWQQIAAFRTTAQPSGILDYVAVASKGGSMTALTVYGFTKSSANLTSTCTDKSAFSLAAADLSSMIPGFPITLTPATTQGTTVTSAAQSIVTSVKNSDSAASANLTFCAVVGGSVTPASTSDLVFNFGLVQD